MDVHGRVPQAMFDQCLEHFPQASVEVVLERANAFLLAKRTNEPAKGEWFWPGSRLQKGETLHDAAHRVAEKELGVGITIEGLLGVYEHFWEDVEPTQHTVNVVYRASSAEPDAEVSIDEQHSEYQWISEPAEAFHPYVNEYLVDLRQDGRP